MGSNSPSPTHQDALRLTAMGFKVQYLAPPVIGTRSTGKRPIETGWQTKGFTPDPGPPPRPGCNLGVQTGKVEGARVQVVVVDLDSPEALEWGQEHLPSTFLQTSTGHGKHLFYRYPGETVKIPNKCRFTLPNGTKLAIDVRGDAGNIVVAPSIHWSGCVYEEVEPWDQVDLSTVPTYNPDWLNGHKISRRPNGSAAYFEWRYAQDASKTSDTPNLDSLSEGFSDEPPTDDERHGLLPEEFQTRLYNNCRLKYGGDQAITALKAMANGQPYAEDGERNATLFQAVRLLAEWFHEVPDSYIEEFVRSSLLATGDKPEHEELAVFRGVLRGSREKFAKRDHMLLHMFKKGIAPTRALIAAGQDISRALIIGFANGYHLSMQQDGSYGVAARKRGELLPSIGHENILGWAVRGGIAEFDYVDNKGKLKTHDWDYVAKKHVWPINRTLGSFSLEISKVEGDTFFEAIAPRREDLRPLYNHKVQTWLELFGGENSALLLDWAATFPQLGRPTSALFVIGAAGAGKNLWADGLARFWVSGKPVPFEVTQRPFNEDLEKSPFIFADEKLPLDPRGHIELDTHLRALITSTTQTLYRKHQKAVQVDGALRILAATNQHNFVFKGMDHESKKALAERILLVEPRENAADYLKALGGRDALEEWVAGDAIIKHVLWLAENRTVRPGTRLLVPGNGLRLINEAQNKEGAPGDLCTWLCNYLLDPRRAKGVVAHAVRFGATAEPGQLWVSAPLLSQAGEEIWCRYVRHGRASMPSQTKLSDILAPLSLGESKQRRGVPTQFAETGRARYHTIDLEQLYAFARKHDYIVEDLEEVLGGVPPRNSSCPPAPPAPQSPLSSEERREKFVTAHESVVKDYAPLLSALAVVEKRERVSEALEQISVQNAPMFAALSTSFEEPKQPKKPRAKKEPKAKPEKVREVRTDDYFSPEYFPLTLALHAAHVSTEAESVAFFAPYLSEAMSCVKGPGFSHPATYARLTAAYRAHRYALRLGKTIGEAAYAAQQSYIDQGERPWVAETSLTPLVRGATQEERAES